MKAYSTTREVGSIDVALGHSSLGATGEGLNEKEALLDCFDGSWIQDFGNAADSALELRQNLMAKLNSVTQWVESEDRPRSKRQAKLDGTAWWLGLLPKPDG